MTTVSGMPLLLAACRLLPLLVTSSAAADEGPVVSTKNGDLRGATLKSFIGNDYFAFKGKACIGLFRRFAFIKISYSYQ